jgi:hypothetical protein
MMWCWRHRMYVVSLYLSQPPLTHVVCSASPPDDCFYSGSKHLAGTKINNERTKKSWGRHKINYIHAISSLYRKVSLWKPLELLWTRQNKNCCILSPSLPSFLPSCIARTPYLCLCLLVFYCSTSFFLSISLCRTATKKSTRNSTNLMISLVSSNVAFAPRR